MSPRDRTVRGIKRLRVLVLFVLFATVGHIYYWYWPRDRPAAPDGTSRVVALLLGEKGFDLRMWIPFPHQNLAALEDRLGDLEEIHQASRILLGSEPTGLPSFGPFRAPPARELVVATDPTGTDFMAAAQVYPLAAWIFKAAGRLADNAWMSGGDLTLGDRQLHIEWDGSLWVVASSPLDLARLDLDNELEIDPCLALLRVERRIGPLPSGLLRLTLPDRRLVLTTDPRDEREASVAAGDLLEGETTLSWIRTRASNGTPEVQALVALAAPGNDSLSIPPFLALRTDGMEAVSLPGEKLLGAVGFQIFSRSLGRWELRSYDEWALESADALVAELQTMAEALPRGSSQRFAYIDLVRARETLTAVARALQEVPILGETQARKWLAGARLLEAMPEFGSASVRVVNESRVIVEIRPNAAN